MKLLIISLILLNTVTTFSYAQKLNISVDLSSKIEQMNDVDKFIYLLSTRSDYADNYLENTDLYLSRSNEEYIHSYTKPVATNDLKGKNLENRALNLLKTQHRKFNKDNIHLLELEDSRREYETLRYVGSESWVYENAQLNLKYERLSFLRNQSSLKAKNDIPIMGILVKVHASSDGRKYNKTIALHSSDFLLKKVNGVSSFQSLLSLSIDSKFRSEISELKSDIAKAGLDIQSIGYYLIGKDQNGRLYMPRNLLEARPDKLMLHSKCSHFFSKWL